MCRGGHHKKQKTEICTHATQAARTHASIFRLFKFVCAGAPARSSKNLKQLCPAAEKTAKRAVVRRFRRDGTTQSARGDRPLAGGPGTGAQNRPTLKKVQIRGDFYYACVLGLKVEQAARVKSAWPTRTNQTYRQTCNSVQPVRGTLKRWDLAVWKRTWASKPRYWAAAGLRGDARTPARPAPTTTSTPHAITHTF